MSSEREELILRLPFIRRFVFEAIKVSGASKFKIDVKEIIDTDLIPKVSKEVMHASMGKKTIPPIPKAPEPIQKPVIPRMYPKPIAHPPMPVIHPPKPFKPTTHRTSPKILIPPKPFIRPKHPIPKAPSQLKPKTNEVAKPIEGYGKINPLLGDKTISTIECPGPGKQVIIVRMGQRQITKIILGPKEIQEILDTVSDQAHIPLLEGVFRAAVDSFSISAVISEMIGSKFVIKKHTPYSLLEK